MPSQNDPPAPPGFPNTYLQHTHQVHEEVSAWAEFCVAHALALLATSVVLLPFTIDHLGSIGPFRCSLLFGSLDMAADSPAAPPPPWTSDTFTSQPTSYQLYQDTLHYTPTTILPKANQQWQTALLNTCYGSTYHTHFPTQWAMQALTLNILIALITHSPTYSTTFQNNSMMHYNDAT